MAFWTVARLAWAVSFLVVYIQNIELLEDSDTPWWSFILLSLYLLCEVVPIYYMLKSSFKHIVVLDENNSKNILPASGHGDLSSSQYEPPSNSGENSYFFEGNPENSLIDNSSRSIDSGGISSGHMSEYTM